MKKTILEFCRRGLMGCGIAPLVLALIYGILYQKGVVEMLTVREVCLGIVSISVLAFVAGGMNVLYQIERLPLMTAILIHGTVLYFLYLITYLVNGWLEQGLTPLLMFTVIFVIGYLAIWAVIYALTKRKTERLNEMLKQHTPEAQ